jgi:hypothetical protein
VVVEQVARNLTHREDPAICYRNSPRTETLALARV